MKVLGFLHAELNRQLRDGINPSRVVMGSAAKAMFLREAPALEVESPSVCSPGAFAEYFWLSMYEDNTKAPGYIELF